MQNDIKALVTANASKEPLTKEAALALAREVKEVIAMRGAKVTRILISDKTTDAELLDVIIGPSGKLRAPTVRAGETLLVGFYDQTYRQALYD